jgi:competence protein ComGC
MKGVYKKYKGYSVLEVLISFLIVLILILLAYYYYNRTQEDSKIAVFVSNKRYIMLACYRYYLDKNTLPNSLLDLFTDPYRDYLPKSLHSYFILSSWDSQILIYSNYYPLFFISYLYLEIRDLKLNKNFVPKNTQLKLISNLKNDFVKYKIINNKEYMVFKLLYLVR